MPKVPDGWVDDVIDRGVVVVPGDAFGEHGAGYARISYATDMETLEEAIDIMADATASLRESIEANGTNVSRTHSIDITVTSFSTDTTPS